MKYAHFKLKCMAVQVNKFQKLVQTQSILYLFHSLSTLIIQANDAWIQCCIIVNECGAYSRATLKGVNTVSSIIKGKGKVLFISAVHQRKGLVLLQTTWTTWECYYICLTLLKFLQMQLNTSSLGFNRPATICDMMFPKVIIPRTALPSIIHTLRIVLTGTLQ